MKLEEAVKRRRKNKNYCLLEGWAGKKKQKTLSDDSMSMPAPMKILSRFSRPW